MSATSSLYKRFYKSHLPDHPKRASNHPEAQEHQQVDPTPFERLHPTSRWQILHDLKLCCWRLLRD